MKETFYTPRLAGNHALRATATWRGERLYGSAAMTHALTMLESRRNKVTLDKLFNEIESDRKDFYRGVSLKCKSWLCEHCRLGKGLELKERFKAKAAMFKAPRLYTITVNRDWFQSPAEAYHYVMSKKFIARLLTKEFNIRRWVWVLEAQEESGDGWPHWHILIDVSDLPGTWYNKNTKATQEEKPVDSDNWCYIPHFFDLNRVHHLLRKWHIGEQCYLTVKRENFVNPEHAINYIVKYLIKTPERGFPPWMLKTPRLRFYQPSYDVGSMNTESDVLPKLEKKTPERHNQPPRPPVERVAECGKQVIFIRYDNGRDRHIATEPIWALKESIPLTSGGVCVEDFNFKTQKAFPVWGFNSLADIGNFEMYWYEPAMRGALQEQIEKEKAAMLARWNDSRQSAA